ncbi:hypothetical protein GQ43DRAFT_40720 [Delitschia confertaspora ATCC 74209]|uniref:Uncharacterized protein n=1 Tax=Delitschia confertaspora ATCC 74209 TaxID=1513339 RepID=A0A9P4JQ95_9PLEO|nr:hypothetical protein GQ43DRAFT_40720 [Delitschia confertaspora ATCC 74209]
MGASEKADITPKSLLNSRWARRDNRSQLTSTIQKQTPAERAAEEKEKAQRLLRRLHWKGESLLSSYKRAIDILHAGTQTGPAVAHRYQFLLGGNVDEAQWTMAKKTAESMFKLDFFEWYTVMERYVTLCLGLLGVHVSGFGVGMNVNALLQSTTANTANGGGTNGYSTHQFHANLLTALDAESCPLHAALGNQDVRIQLGLAKDYRNRWKDADEVEDGADSRKTAIKLEDLELENMVGVILAGTREALVVVMTGASVVKNGGPKHYGSSDEFGYDMEVEMGDAPFEAVYDAMDSVDAMALDDL